MPTYYGICGQIHAGQWGALLGSRGIVKTGFLDVQATEVPSTSVLIPVLYTLLQPGVDFIGYIHTP
jgi:hypothetical protein